jgi:uncharacterized phiE125 gp8 family phage protein
MSVTPVNLKTNVFLTLDDAKSHLRIALTDTQYDNKVKRLLQMATDLCEKYIDGPIKSRQFTETRDGDSSDTMVPDYYPVRSIEEIRIDYNRQFDAPTIINASSYILRGTQDLGVGIKGLDVVIRDDNNTSIVGRIFTGSVVGAIQLKYTAGWGTDMDSIPYDLQHAVLMTMEYYYLVGENRELNLKRKQNNQNQSYERDSGLPKEVEQILDSYKDVTLGRNNKPQRNTFVL